MTQDKILATIRAAAESDGVNDSAWISCVAVAIAGSDLGMMVADRHIAPLAYDAAARALNALRALEGEDV